MWRLKLALKIAGGKLSLIRKALRAFGYYRHGPMDSPTYAIGVFNKHAMRAKVLIGKEGQEIDLWPGRVEIPRDRPIASANGGTCLELGPGESLLTMLVAKAVGFERTVFVDKGVQIRNDIRPYLELVTHLRKLGYALPPIDPRDSVESLLPKFGAVYLTDGLESLRSVPDASIDFSFSHAVLEHVPRNEAKDFLYELMRVLSPDGFSSHTVDLKDHLGGSMNHLRFTEGFWESSAVRDSGIYTNRLRFHEWMELLKANGSTYQILWKNYFPACLPPSHLASPFRALGEQDLRISGFDIVMRMNPGLEGRSCERDGLHESVLCPSGP